MATPHVAGAAAQLRATHADLRLEPSTTVCSRPLASAPESLRSGHVCARRYPSLSAAEATEALLCLATPDVVTDTMGSPNLFLYADLPRLPHPITAFTIAPRPPSLPPSPPPPTSSFTASSHFAQVRGQRRLGLPAHAHLRPPPGRVCGAGFQPQMTSQSANCDRSVLTRPLGHTSDTARASTRITARPIPTAPAAPSVCRSPRLKPRIGSRERLYGRSCDRAPSYGSRHRRGHTGMVRRL